MITLDTREAEAQLARHRAALDRLQAPTRRWPLALYAYLALAPLAAIWRRWRTR